MNSIYLLALIPYIPVWMYMNVKGSVQIKKEMLVMSFLVAVVSPVASYLWWNKDWWMPPSLWGGAKLHFYSRRYTPWFFIRWHSRSYL